MSTAAHTAAVLAAAAGEEIEGIQLLLPAAYDIIWSVVVIVIIAVPFYKYALPRLNAVLEQRAELIEGGIAKAAVAQEEAEAAREEYKAQLAEARTEAARIREDAAAYQDRVVNEAEGQAARFLSIFNEYAQAPEVTRRRLFLETMEQVLGGSNKVIVESGAGGSGVIPYLPLPELQSRAQSRTGAGLQSQGGQ